MAQHLPSIGKKAGRWKGGQEGKESENHKIFKEKKMNECMSNESIGERNRG